MIQTYDWTAPMKRPPEDLSAKLLAASSRLGGAGVDVSIDEMAKEAGVPRATLYYYFAGKDDLVAFLFDDKVTSAATAIEKAIASEGPTSHRLEQVVHAIYTSMASQPALCLEMPTALRNPDTFGETLAHAEEALMIPLRQLLEEGIDEGFFSIPDIAVALVFMQGAIWQTAMVNLLEFGTLDAEALTAATTPLLLGAFGA